MNRLLPPIVRRLVLGSAMLLAMLVAILPESSAVRAATAYDHPATLLAQDAVKEAAESAREAAREASNAARDAAREASDAAREASREARRKGLRIGVDGVDGVDRQYDSFDQFLDRDPALAAMVLGIVFIVFLTPILIIALIVWYKVRKNRMQNDAMLQLAERGVVPAADAMHAISAGRAAPMLSAANASAPLAEQVRTLRKQAAWSDLRKGVLMGGIGLALTVYGLFEEGSPGWLALVLLFVGIGYVVLWYFEDRQDAAAPERAAAPAPRPGPGDPTH